MNGWADKWMEGREEGRKGRKKEERIYIDTSNSN